MTCSLLEVSARWCCGAQVADLRSSPRMTSILDAESTGSQLLQRNSHSDARPGRHLNECQRMGLHGSVEVSTGLERAPAHRRSHRLAAHQIWCWRPGDAATMPYRFATRQGCQKCDLRHAMCVGRSTENALTCKDVTLYARRGNSVLRAAFVCPATCEAILALGASAGGRG